MAPNNPNSYYSIPPTVAVRQPSPFARAIESFLADVRRSEEVKSPFYKEVLCNLSNIALHDDSAQQSQQAAKALSAFIEDMDCRKRRDSKMIRFGERLRPLVVGLSQFTAAADIAIQATPKAAVILYSGARLVLQLAQNFYKCFDTVLDIMANIGNLLRCYELYSTAYHSSEDIQDLLFESYKNIIVFWQKAAGLLGRKSYKSILTGLLKPLDAEWQKCRECLERDCNRVRDLGQATGAELQRQRDLTNGQIRQKEERRQLVEWLKAGEENDVRIDLRTHLELHQTRTGEWLYEHPNFRNWVDSKEQATLWFHAGPGSGKTVLSSALIDHLQMEGLKVVYFFCSFNDPSRRKAISAIRSLALQIMTLTDTVPDQVVKLYETDVAHHLFALKDPQTATMVLQAFLKKLPSHLPRLHIVLDGLDECHDGDQMRSSLSRLISTDTYGLIKWFFTSRPESEIQKMAYQVNAEEIVPSATVLINDITRYLQDRTTRDDYPMCCVESWAAASEGNFLWMSLMLKILVGMDLTCDEEIDEELNKFPSGLAGCYLRSIQQLSLRSKPHQELARRIFAILVVAEQPLHLSELSNYLGIREGAEDFSAKRIPKLALIEDLCSHLVVFDRVSKGNEKDPLLKLAHKSVQDFFSQDPDSLDMPVPDDLRKFFVNEGLANLEMGKACLTYLRYKRYLSPLEDLKLVNEEDHVFLKYAATFWFRHLMRTGHSQDLFSSVEQFIRSPAFWTCLIVQCHVAPHLFAQLVEVRPGVYRLRAGKLVGSEKLGDQKLNFAFPLPHWLEEYSPSGPIIIQEFLRFIKEWHSVLTCYPEALCHCIRDFSGNTYPCCNPLQPKSVRVLKLFSSDAISNRSKSSLGSFEMDENIIQATVVAQNDSPKRKFSIDQVYISNCSAVSPQISRETSYERIIATNSSSCHFHATFGSVNGDISTWALDLSTLNMIRDNGLEVSTFMTTGTVEKFKSSPEYDGQTPWIVISKPSMNNYRTLSGFHCFKPAICREDERDSGYCSPHSDSDSDEESDDEPNEEYSHRTYHCIALVSHGYSPLWFAWHSNAKAELQVSCATHPTEPIALWSHAPYEFRLADLRTGEIKSGIFQEPVDIQLRSASAVRKEMHFSEDGQSLYYLLCSFVDDPEGSICSISVSSFQFPGNVHDLEDDLLRSGLSQHLTYHVSKTVKEISPTLILTHWTAQYLYLALPIISSRPKIVRLALNSSSVPDTSRFQTLQNPLYFPASTHCRNPQIFVSTSADAFNNIGPNASLEQLILALDPDLTSTTEEQSMAFVSAPTLMVWSISETNSWRDWSEKSDERAPELEFGHRTYAMLRGTFVDPEQRFSIPIRSGLDWTKKAFLSCA